MEIHNSNFNIVKYVWAQNLWPKRKSLIEEVSYIDSSGDITLENKNIKKPVFWIMKKLSSSNNELQNIIATLSGYQINNYQFRIRGLWIHPDYRRLGLSQKLFLHAEKYAIDLSCKTLWSMPRYSALLSYLKFDFKVFKKLEQYEFGSHFIVKKDIS